MNRIRHIYIFLMIAAGAAAGCNGGSSGTAALDGGIGSVVSAQGNGVEVQFDPDALPIPIIPLPNDALTRPDTGSTTGRRINIPTDSDTQFEFRIRAAINDLDGFGTFQPISIPFTGPIDLDTITPNFDDDLTNDTIIVVNVSPESDRYGEAVAWDPVGAFNPIDISGEKPKTFLFKSFDQDVALAKFRDGVTLKNLIYPSENRFNYYEDRTSTVLLRPLIPMEPKAKYAVYVTRRVRDANGNIPRSPFRPAIALFTQFKDLNAGLPVLRDRYGLSAGDVAFAFSFTTMDLFRPLDRVREGLNGNGDLAYLRTTYPPRFKLFDPATEDGSILLPPSQVQLLAALVGPVLAGDLSNILDTGGPFLDVIFKEFDLSDVAYVLGGAYEAPSFIGERGTFQPGVIEGRQRLDPANPKDVEEVSFLMTVPKAKPRVIGWSNPPFPVLNFVHANQTDRIIAAAMARTAAEFGVAVIAINQPAHGPLFPKPREQLIRLLATQGDTATAQLLVDNLPLILALVNTLGLSNFPVDEPPPAKLSITELIAEVVDRTALVTGLSQQELIDALADIPIVNFIFGRGRAKEDADHDGLIENGEAFFTADLGKTRDILRQTMIELMQLDRLIKDLCKDHDGDGKLGPLEGDFDEDGRCDIGGADTPIFVSGISQGGLISSAFMGVEDIVKNAFINVPGGGFSQVMQRSSLDFVVQRIFLQILGPMAVAVPYDPEDPEASEAIGLSPGKVAVTFIDKDVGADVKSLSKINAALPEGEVIHTWGVFDAPPETDLAQVGTPGFQYPVVVENLTRGLREEGFVGPDGAFSIGIPTDIGDRIRITFPTGQWEITSVGEGLGIPRNHERFRRFNDIAQLMIDPSDSLNYGTRWVKYPPKGVQRKNVLIQSDPGDTTVPISSQLQLVRGAGLLNPELDRAFMDAHLITGEKNIPDDEDIPGLSSRWEDLCVCQDLTQREPTCEAEDFNDIIGTGRAYRDALWDRLRAETGEDNYSIFTWHVGGRHEYMLAPDQTTPAGALRYTIGAQRQGMMYLIDPTQFDPRISTYQRECAMNILDFNDLESIGRSVTELNHIFEPYCGGCAVQIDCGEGCETVRVQYLTPLAAAANALVWISPLFGVAILRRRIRRE
ncbi:MAG: hypothetical protein KC466_00330 [Myxococcales bacterium]|nr:hypothetical protein [Myxococcales bacterium]